MLIEININKIEVIINGKIYRLNRACLIEGIKIKWVKILCKMMLFIMINQR